MKAQNPDVVQRARGNPYTAKEDCPPGHKAGRIEIQVQMVVFEQGLVGRDVRLVDRHRPQVWSAIEREQPNGRFSTMLQ